MFKTADPLSRASLVELLKKVFSRFTVENDLSQFLQEVHHIASISVRLLEAYHDYRREELAEYF